MADSNGGVMTSPFSKQQRMYVSISGFCKALKL